MRHIPNVLSSFRIVLIPFFAYFAARGELVLAAVILIVSAVTDLLDGFLARRFGWVSNLGKILDPIADKLTQIVVCVLFVTLFPALWPFFAVLIFKELTMLVLGSILLKRGIPFGGSRWFGKGTTAFFYLSMILIALFPALPLPVVYALLIITTICALITGILYVIEIFSKNNSKQKQE